MTIIYRTPGVWGGGQGSNLTAAQVDENFFDLFSAITALQDHSLTSENQIDYFATAGNQLYVHMMNHEVFGPYTLPTAQWNFRGPWTALTTYNFMDVFTANGAVYLVIFPPTGTPYTSASTFSANANDGSGHNYYGLLLAQPEDELPTGGTVGQVLAMATGSPYNTEWSSLTRVFGLFVAGTPLSDELLLQYIIPEEMTFPSGLTGSEAYCGTEPTTDQVFNLYQNGVAIGSITFSPSPSTNFTLTAAVTFNPGDKLTLVAPSSVDPHMANISITLVATLP
jgi:hypothetical protein